MNPTHDNGCDPAFMAALERGEHLKPFQGEQAAGTVVLDLEHLLDDYWNAAYTEGREGRAHDTAEGSAQKALSAIRACVAQRVAVERERCAAALALTPSQLRLMAGEMSAQEMRTVQAVLNALAIKIRRGD